MDWGVSPKLAHGKDVSLSRAEQLLTPRTPNMHSEASPKPSCLAKEAIDEKNEEKSEEVLEILLSSGFRIGAAVGAGDYFAGSVVQGQNEFKDEDLITSNRNVNVTSLEDDCVCSAGEERGGIVRDAKEGSYFVSQENIAVLVTDIEECGENSTKTVCGMEGQNSPLLDYYLTEPFNLGDYDLGDSDLGNPDLKKHAQLIQNKEESDSVIPKLIKEKHSEPFDNHVFDNQPESEAIRLSDEKQKLKPVPSHQISSPRELLSRLPESRKETSNNDICQPGTSADEQGSQKLLPSSTNFFDGMYSNASDNPSVDFVNPKVQSSTSKVRRSSKCCENDSDLKSIPTDTNCKEGSQSERVNTRDKNRETISFGEDEYVVGKWQNNRLMRLDSCQFTHPYRNETVYIRKQIHGYLFTVDEEDFIARVHCNKLEELDLAELSTNTKRDFLKKFLITEMIKDNSVNDRDAAYNQFKRLLRDRSIKTADNIKYAEDIFQLSTIPGNYRQSSNKSILDIIVNNKYISSDLKDTTRQLLDREKTVDARRRDFLRGDRYCQMDLLKELHEICVSGAKYHKKSLLDKCSSFVSLLDDLIDSNIDSISGQEIFYISNTDMNLFSDLANEMSTQPFLEFFRNSLGLLFRKVMDKKKHKSLEDFAPLTHPVYFYLCKHFQELILEISDKTDISVNDLLQKEKLGKWELIKTIDWPSTSPLNHFLEQQYRFTFNLMKLFGPGYYSKTGKFKYQFKLLYRSDEKSILESIKNLFYSSNKFSDIPEDRLVWMYLLDSAIAELFSNNSQNCFELFEPLLDGSTSFIQETKDAHYESFRIVMHNTVRFIAQTIPCLSKGSLAIDRATLSKQIKSIEKIISGNQLNDFRDIIDVYNEYWKNRESVIEKIPDKFPYGKFKQDMEKIRQKLFNIVNTVLSKEVKPQELMKYFRSFNEFLEHLSAVKFSWFIKDISDSTEKDVKLVNEDKKSYEVLDPENFTKRHGKNVPRHYLIEVIEGLLDIVINLLGQKKWSNDDNLNAANELVLAIGKSFLYLKEQRNYLDFSTFQEESTMPFSSVVENSSSYEDFKKRIVIIGESFWYLRKQDEINVAKALELYREENAYSTVKTEETLKSCYNRYLEKFNSYIQKTLDKNYEDKIKCITEEVKDQFKLININKWEENFKKETLPELLAGLAAAWSVQASKDIASRGKTLKPNCIQILCIFLLLSVDKDSEGVDKHLAQVLTGQGKSLVLGFLSSLLALMGYKVQTVCYSEYLATRDAEDFYKLFREFGITDKISYCTFAEMADEVIEPKINGNKQGLRELVEDRIRKHSTEQSRHIHQEDISNTILLIDEVDVFFNHRFYGNIQRAATIIGMPALVSIQEKIWKMARKNYEKSTILKEIEEFIKKVVGKKNADFIEFNEFLLNSKKYCLLEEDNNVIIKKKYNNQSLFKEHLNRMIDDAIHVANAESFDWFIRTYALTNSGIICYKNEDGVYCVDTYVGYYNVFNYFRLKEKDYCPKAFLNYGYLNIYCGAVSYAKLPERYPLILGVSGTLTTLNDYERKAVKESYKIQKISTMPSFFGRCNIKFHTYNDFICSNSEKRWLNKIFEHANLKIRSRRSVLIFFDTDVLIDKFKETYCSKFDRLHTLTENTEVQTKKKYIDEAGITKTITLATRGMGRGVDFKSSLAVENNGGVHVIQTFFSVDIKEETQIKGRTARKDNKGSYQLILCKEHLINAGVLEEQETTVTYESLCKSRERIIKQIRSKDWQRIKASEENHKITIEFLESFFKTSM